MLKLDELPPEIVDVILRIGSDRSASAKLRYQDLKSFSRISSSFQSPSQRVMSERVSLSTVKAAKAWVESGSRMYGTKEMEFREDRCDSDPAGTMSTDDVRAAIRVCRPGLEKLVMLTVEKLD